ncbi:MAG: phosphoglycerate kinase, partial [Acidobacteriota bacterium]
MPKVSIRDLDLQGKRVFIRADLNVPLSESGEITDDTRIRAVFPTLEMARRKGARVVVASHLGRPKGKPNPRMSLRCVAKRLSQVLGCEVGFATDCVGEVAAQAAAALKGGEVLLLENLRFHPEEEKNDRAFAGQLAAL